jgi:tRNA threonylcarbamoyladenosine biosynthesis protein TsaE
MTHDPDHRPEPATLHLRDEQATLALGAALARVIERGLSIWLQGELGSGKTTLVRGVLRALGHGGKVKSPTYTLVELYVVSRLDLYHLDLYRFERPEEYLDAGLDECFRRDAVCMVEWAERALPHIPPADVLVRLAVCGQGRSASVEAGSERGIACLTALLQTREWQRLAGDAGDPS